MDEQPIRRRPEPGEYVRVGTLPGLFQVLDSDGSTLRLLSEHGVVCRAGITIVRVADPDRGSEAA